MGCFLGHDRTSAPAFGVRRDRVGNRQISDGRAHPNSWHPIQIIIAYADKTSAHQNEAICYSASECSGRFNSPDWPVG